ncbi:hypothetical protein HYX02_03055 [Candidatus Woesearchaeota archaeon]|nr:hypothetical protein [Candidatus Woesearchaeota archaeon]
MTQLERLLSIYFQEVSKIQPFLIDIDSPKGIKDVLRQLNALERRRLHSRDLYFIAFEGDLIYGFVSFNGKRDLLQETHLMVDRAYRGGLGTKLRMALFSYGKIHGHQEAILYNVTPKAYRTFLNAVRLMALPWETEFEVNGKIHKNVASDEYGALMERALESRVHCESVCRAFLRQDYKHVLQR